MELIARPKSGDVLDATRTMYPCRLEVFSGERTFQRPTSTTWGVVARGTARLRAGRGFELACDEGAYFCVPGDFALESDGGVVLIERFGFRGLLGAGRIEPVGRLSYIDGCSDTVLSMPPRLGDPVLNLLHFPPGVVQTRHTHPSVRLGVVVGGRGVAHGPDPRGGSWEQPLETGAVFNLAAHEVHAFRTEAASAMDIVAFHPDSDWGPTDAQHPMLNRTYIARGAPST